MNPLVIGFIVIYIALLILYFFTETSGNIKLRAPNKIALALMFSSFGIASFVLNPFYSNSSYHVLLVVSILLAALGDIFLLFSFSTGLNFFLAGNICFVAYYICLLDNNKIKINSYWWAFLVSAVMVLILALSFEKFPKLFKVGKYKPAVIFYASTIFTHGLLGVATMALLPNFTLLGVGSFLFMLSDIDIVFHKFVVPNNKMVHRLNSALYFVGLLCIVLSMSI